MSSPRKFAEKIALIQQKQAEGDAAFKTILNEVEAAKQRTDRDTSSKRKLDVPTRKYEIPFEGGYPISNGMNNSDNNNYNNQSIKMETHNGSDRLLQLPENTSWRRTHSDPSLHQATMPTVGAHYHAPLDNENNGQQLNYDMNDIEFDPTSNGGYYHCLQTSNSSFQPQILPYYDFNNNNYANGRTNINYAQAPSIPQQTVVSPVTTNNTHTSLGSRYSSGSNNSNVLMLPPNQHPRGGGSLPDLRTGDGYNNQQVSYSTDPSLPTSTNSQFFRSTSPQQNDDRDLFALGPQQHLRSNSGPLKTSPSIRRRHSPIGDIKQSSPRRQNSPSPDVPSTQQTVYRVEPSSPQSQSSYSPQNSPHLLPSPNNELGPFSPQQSSDNHQQTFFTLPNHFDQITLDNNFYTHQQPSSPSTQQKRNNSLPTTPASVNDDNSNYLRQNHFYPSFIDNTPTSYCHNQSTANSTANVIKKSPTIPNIILTDVDSSKLDLSKELGNDFSSTFDSLLDPADLQLNTDDFLLNVGDLSIDQISCDDSFRMER